MMHIRLCFALAMMVTMLAPPDALAQRRVDGDQPGYEPTQDEERADPKFQRTVVFYRTAEAPGTIIVHTNERFLYVVQSGGRAVRYGIGVGREGFQWQGLLKISRKQEWPDWTPPEEMIAAPALSAALDGRRPGQSARCARALSRRDGLSDPRHQPAVDHWQRGVVGMLPSDQSRCHGSVRPHSGRHQGDRPAAARSLTRRGSAEQWLGCSAGISAPACCSDA